MSDEFKEPINIKPELSFEPFQEEVLDVKVQEEKIEEEKVDEIQLTEKGW